jgi:hypothetical protein
VTWAAGAHIIIAMQVRTETFRGEQCDKLQPLTIDLFTVNARITLLGGLVYARPYKFYIAPFILVISKLYISRQNAFHAVMEIDNRHLLFVSHEMKQMPLKSLSKLTVRDKPLINKCLLHRALIPIWIDEWYVFILSGC